MKMTQVQIKIEEFFDNKIMIDVKPDIWDGTQAETVFVAQIHRSYEDKILEKINWNISILKPNESRKTIMQSLWKYQNSLLPNKYELKVDINNNDEFHFENIELSGASVVDDNYETKISFYDDITRIITITKFEED